MCIRDRAWKGPRHCSVSGAVAPLTRPQRGLPQGSSVAPAAMVLSLTPWQPVSGQAYMDDRSLTAANGDLLQDDLQYTALSDQED
eukprot:1955763-Pyramimonas_sp.AAC.1